MKYLPQAMISSRQATAARLLLPRSQDMALSVSFSMLRLLAEELKATDYTLTQSSLDQVSESNSTIQHLPGFPSVLVSKRLVVMKLYCVLSRGRSPRLYRACILFTRLHNDNYVRPKSLDLKAESFQFIDIAVRTHTHVHTRAPGIFHYRNIILLP